MTGFRPVDFPQEPDGCVELRVDSGGAESAHATRFAGTVVTQQDGRVAFDYEGTVSRHDRIKEGEPRILEDGETERMRLERHQ